MPKGFHKIKGRTLKGFDGKKPTVMYPTVHFFKEELPAVETWDVDTEYTITLHVRMTSKSIRESKKGGKRIDGTFDILGTMADPKLNKKQKDNIDFMTK